MKVGIVSQFGNENMGNKLQNYALQQYLLNYADSVITIKNKPKAKNAVDYLRRFTFMAESEWINRLCGKRRKTAFLRFHNRYIRDSRASYRIDRKTFSLKKADRCDLYCSGSDQVWKPNSGLTGPIHYLTFAQRERTFSYAASFGVDQIPEQYRETVRAGLRHVKYISVREDAGKRIVEELTGRTDVQVVVDPTMLLSAREWDQVAEKPRTALPEKYLLTYFLGDVSPRRRAVIQKKADEMGCQVINLMDQSSSFYAEGPSAFVYMIKNAACVCTDSFHGSVFAFLYGRPLAIMDRQGSGDNMGSRLVTLAEKFSLQGCLVTGDCLPDLPEKPDYSAGFAALEEERKKAAAYLNLVFKEAERAKLCD